MMLLAVARIWPHRLCLSFQVGENSSRWRARRRSISLVAGKEKGSGRHNDTSRSLCPQVCFC